jgi:1-deoxy-D-xylulose-5-phosphate reductoisomerase
VTGSGGPFRGWRRDELARASVKEALAHPIWRMGRKITIDSATLMNKGLEVIEAHFLFDLDYSAIDVVIHPEGVIHGIAEFRDGSMMAQMAPADMRLPIQVALAWPERLPTGIEPFRLVREEGPVSLSFEPPDREAFPALDLAYRAGRLGITYPAVLNAANEAAVSAFLVGGIKLTDVTDIAERVMGEHQPPRVVSVVSLERADSWARQRAAALAREL